MQAYTESFWTGTSRMDALDEALAAMGGTPNLDAAPVAEIERPFDRSSPYFQACIKCGGRGSVRWGTCFKCNGAGGWMRKTTQHERDADRSAAAKRLADKAALSEDGFKAEYPVEHGWIVSHMEHFDFAASLYAALLKYGYLTDGQLAAARKCMLRDVERDMARTQAAVQRVEAAPVVAQDKLTDAFQAAHAHGLKRPELRFNGFTASMAPATGKNPGAVYIKAGRSTYLGKITGGKFYASRECGAAGDGLAQAIATTMQDPVTAAIEYGRSTGTCSCCGRKLTDPKSVARGIGPDCAEKYGF